MYLTYAEYRNMGGTLDETTFKNYLFNAEALINYYTFNRLKNDTTVDSAVTQLTYYLIDLAEKKNSSLGLGMSNMTSGVSEVYIQRQSNDGVDTTYNSMSATSLYQLCKTESYKAIKSYLSEVVNEAGQKVLYRGLYPGE